MHLCVHMCYLQGRHGTAMNLKCDGEYMGARTLYVEDLFPYDWSKNYSC